MKQGKKTFKTNHIKYGGYSMLMTGILLVILIMVNLAADKINMKVDVTKSQLFSVSDQTKSLLQTLDEDITIYVLEETGKENRLFKNILEHYEKLSSHIQILYKDPILYPLFGEKYKKDGAIVTGSIIVESKKRYIILEPNSLYHVQYDSEKQVNTESYVLEEKVTNALEYVTSDQSYTIYLVTGHGEKEMPQVLSQQLQNENYERRSVSLLDDLTLHPEDIVFIHAPKKDLLEEEANRLRSFLEKGGKAVILLDYTMPALPHLNQVLAYYGMEVQKGIIFEGDPSFMYPGYPNYTVPYITKHDITRPLLDAKIPVVIPFSLGLSEMTIKRDEVEHIPLLTTSKEAYLKTNPEAKTYEKEEVDIPGPLTIAMAATEEILTEGLPQEMKLLVIGSSVFLEEERVPLESIGNVDFMMNGFNWLLGEKKHTYVRPKSQETYSLNLNFNQLILYGILFAVVFPLVFVGIGITVRLRRKHL